jgi:hypothetical protein
LAEALVNVLIDICGAMYFGRDIEEESADREERYPEDEHCCEEVEYRARCGD